MDNRNHGQNLVVGNEIITLIFFSIYNLGMFFFSLKMGWEIWRMAVILICLVLCWIVCMGRYKEYEFRVVFTTVMMQISINLFAFRLDDFYVILPVFVALAVLVGLYGNLDALYVTVVSTLVLFFTYGVVREPLWHTSFEQAALAVLQMVNIFLVEFFLHIWISKRNEVGRQNLRTIEILKEAEQSKDDFLANVSHEIRTPVNTICGMSEMVLQEEIPLKIREQMFDIMAAGRNLMSVVSDVLDFSELQSGKLEIEEEAYNITSTINDVINMTLAKKEEKQIQLLMDCDADIPCGLLGDEKKIRRVIMNLVDNAIKFTEEGCVTIMVTHRRETYGINLCVTIKDTGIGMTEESLENLFGSFNQVDARSSRRRDGIGLGIAISQIIIRKMGGIITAKSRLGKGSMVKFVIPQKVLDERPITHVSNREELNVAAYINMEQFEMTAVRDEYSNIIRHMTGQLKVKCHMCRNLPELKRRADGRHGSLKPFTHIFISIVEYQEDTPYFDELSQNTNVIIAIDRADEKYLKNPNLLRIYMPFYVVPVVSVLNGRGERESRKQRIGIGRFIAPDAHILVVDDNVMNVKVIEGLLCRYQIKVTMAESGQEALERIEDKKYDFVFMDHMMPGMDGIEAFKRIRRKVGEYYQKVPVIALTANAIAGTRQMFLSEGFSDFVEKPVELSVLERVLKRNLPEEKIIYLSGRDSVSSKDNVNSKDSVSSKDNVNSKDNDSSTDGLEHETDFQIEGFDAGKGILYCGGKEGYLSVLSMHDGCIDDKKRKLEALYEQKDWNGYVIEVHALKSAMLSIGALRLWELAKQAEAFGREGRIEEVIRNHGELMAEYGRVISLLHENPLISHSHLQENHSDGQGSQPAAQESQPAAQESQPDGQGSQPDTQESQPDGHAPEELPENVFLQKMTDMEDAALDFDGEKMLAILSGLGRFWYHGVSLKASLEGIRKKVEMSDYMSASEALAKLKDRLDKGQERKESHA